MKSMLNEKKDRMLLADLQHIAQVAGVHTKYIHYGMKDFCGAEEMDWVRRYHLYNGSGKESVPGLLLVGLDSPEVRCQSIAGSLVRNYIDARVVSLNTVLAAAEGKGSLNPTVLLIPNFFIEVPHSKGKPTLPAWKVQALHDLLLKRSQSNTPTVLYVSSLSALAEEYGTTFAAFLEGFKQVVQKEKKG
jgi:hypothetical protein